MVGDCFDNVFGTFFACTSSWYILELRIEVSVRHACNTPDSGRSVGCNQVHGRLSDLHAFYSAAYHLELDSDSSRTDNPFSAFYPKVVFSKMRSLVHDDWYKRSNMCDCAQKVRIVVGF
jgi:hypothetical protein